MANISELVHGRIWVLYGPNKRFALLLKLINGKSFAMVDMSWTNDCPGRCAYCFLELRRKSCKSKTSHLSRKSVIKIAHIINHVCPDAVTLAEKTEIGFSPKAIALIRYFRELLNPGIEIIVTTKFPEKAYRELDMPGITILTTLSNPLVKNGLEPNVPSVYKRVEAVKNFNLKHAKKGVRILITDRRDIKMFCNIMDGLKPYVNRKRILVGFLRSDRASKNEKFREVVKTFLDESQYAWHKCHGISLKESIMADAIKALVPYGAVFDRLPVDLQYKYRDSSVNVHTNTACYIRTNVPCKSKLCNAQDPKCYGINKKAGLICDNLLAMNYQQHKETWEFWAKEIGPNKRYAWGTRSKTKPSERFVRVIKVLKDEELSRRTGFYPT